MSASTTRRSLKSSSLADLIDERARLQADLSHINGWIAREAEEAGVGNHPSPSGVISVRHVEKEAVRWKEIAVAIDEKKALRMAGNGRHSSEVEYWSAYYAKEGNNGA